MPLCSALFFGGVCVLQSDRSKVEFSSTTTTTTSKEILETFAISSQDSVFVVSETRKGRSSKTVIDEYQRLRIEMHRRMPKLYPDCARARDGIMVDWTHQRRCNFSSFGTRYTDTLDDFIVIAMMEVSRIKACAQKVLQGTQIELTEGVARYLLQHNKKFRPLVLKLVSPLLCLCCDYMCDDIHRECVHV
jgi:hypothetical protein